MKAMDLGDQHRCSAWKASEVAGRDDQISWQAAWMGHAIGQSDQMGEQGLRLAAFSAASFVHDPATTAPVTESLALRRVCD